jgi:hypothetical protein
VSLFRRKKISAHELGFSAREEENRTKSKTYFENRSSSLSLSLKIWKIKFKVSV